MDLKKRIRRYFIAGIIVLLPLFLTINILAISVRFLDNLLGRFIRPYIEIAFGRSFFGLGLIAITIIIFFTGVMAANVFVKKIMPFFERMFLRIPFVYQIYPSIKQLVKFLLSEDKLHFKKVVLFEYPRKEVFTLGFITSEFESRRVAGDELDTVCVYIASAPNPITGFFVIAPKRDVTMLDISIEDAFKIIISGGVLMPTDLLSQKLDSRKNLESKTK